MLLLVGMAVEGHTKSYLRSIKSVKLACPKAEPPRWVRKERLFVSSRRTLYESTKVEKNPEGLDRHVLNMAARYTRFIFVRERLVGESIFGYLRL